MRASTIRTTIATLIALALVFFVTGCGDTTSTGKVKTFSVSAVDGKVEGGATTFKVKPGDHVKITVKSDKPDEVHLHGIDIEEPVESGKPAHVEFDADAQGSYELELHEADLLLGTVEVR